MKQTQKTFFILFAFLVFTGCASDSSDDLTIAPPASVTYVANVSAIINQSCATSGCHNAMSNAAGLTLESYSQVKNAFQNRGALSRMESTTNPMPPSGNLPANSILTIKDWIAQGYLED